MALELFVNDRKYFDKLLDLSYITLAKDGGTDDGFSLPVALISFMYKKSGIQKARDLYKRYISLPHPGLVVYKHCIELEISTGDESSLANACKLFESALTTYTQDISLWQQFYSMETKVERSQIYEMGDLSGDCIEKQWSCGSRVLCREWVRWFDGLRRRRCLPSCSLITNKGK